MNKIYNGIMGLVVGDALGVPVESKERDTYELTDMIGYGTYNQPPGTWSDDSSLTLSTVASIGDLRAIDVRDIMRRFSGWLNEGEYTPHGEAFDVGVTTRLAITRYDCGVDLMDCGGKTEDTNGNGALMRILPVAMLPRNGALNDTCSVKRQAVTDVASLTHRHEVSTFACLYYAAIVEHLMDGMDKHQAVEQAAEAFKFYVHLLPKLTMYKRLRWIHQCSREEIKSSGYVVDTLEAALWCFLTTDSYRDCVLTAVNLGDDTDTIAAVAGGLAGIYYGCGGDAGIPDAWIAQIARADWIQWICDRLQRSLHKIWEGRGV